ncbi:PREDICTED: dolichol-phosphate mannosyltransferase subunit 3-like [Branchiostoma belcheri]|uniref:Dolichol-phosphate mannosyltransferase subunit 3 n=1 Tax=Branchiostoma belcheri TaxID=7741 RepID=A0A6P4YI79_BRABE|nr:PREDICTED: dolichol-phosphate mannosyltransferase subunit 3-like [Branchiostoma belcheri]
MTKLLQWLLGVGLLLGTWACLVWDLVPAQLTPQWKEVVWVAPMYLLMSFACYSLATIGYRVATFNDCEDAAKELQQEIEEARRDLAKKGLKLS